jgi:hypothetical protein
MKPYIISAVVIIIGALQCFGFIFQSDNIRKLGQLTAASPLPLVFSHFRGLETFSPRFFLRVERDQFAPQEVPITPELYSQLDGPYNRRNLYGAAFAYGAVLQKESERQMVNEILRYGFCQNGPIRKLLDSLQITQPHDDLSAVILPKGSAQSVILPIRCTDE